MCECVSARLYVCVRVHVCARVCVRARVCTCEFNVVERCVYRARSARSQYDFHHSRKKNKKDKTVRKPGIEPVTFV